ncbi:MAG: hypothetical protein FWD57_08255 [Polyangiaceae bacterium]|nr:hypothetical protein [Polyangiaceae bacterium]
MRWIDSAHVGVFGGIVLRRRMELLSVRRTVISVGVTWVVSRLASHAPSLSVVPVASVVLFDSIDSGVDGMGWNWWFAYVAATTLQVVVECVGGGP